MEYPRVSPKPVPCPPIFSCPVLFLPAVLREMGLYHRDSGILPQPPPAKLSYYGKIDDAHPDALAYTLTGEGTRLVRSGNCHERFERKGAHGASQNSRRPRQSRRKAILPKQIYNGSVICAIYFFAFFGLLFERL
ncbi:hypothetical protein BJX99DRAFT_222008 [Aspergillus californicus]